MAIQIKIKNVLENKSFLGKVAPSGANNASLCKVKKGHYYVNTNESLAELSKILYLIANITANSGNILIYDVNKFYKTKPNLTIINKWPNGLISNIKSKLNRESKIPSLVLILDNKKEKLDSIIAELSSTGIPYAVIQEDFIKQATYSCVMNINSKKTKRILLKVLQYATLTGMYQEIYGIKDRPI